MGDKPDQSVKHQPSQVTASGQKLEEWFERVRRNEVRISVMTMKQPGVWTLTLVWPKPEQDELTL